MPKSKSSPSFGVKSFAGKMFETTWVNTPPTQDAIVTTRMDYHIFLSHIPIILALSSATRRGGVDPRITQLTRTCMKILEGQALPLK